MYTVLKSYFCASGAYNVVALIGKVVLLIVVDILQTRHFGLNVNEVKLNFSQIIRPKAYGDLLPLSTYIGGVLCRAPGLLREAGGGDAEGEGRATAAAATTTT